MAVENDINANYDDFEVQVVHHRHDGIYASPVAGAGPQYVSKCRLHAPLEFIIIAFTATRIGAPPIVPSPKSYQAQNPNRLFIGGSRSGTMTPTFGGHAYSVSGFYVFCCPVEEGFESTLALAAGPWESGLPGFNLHDFQIPSGNFTKAGILNPLLNALPLSPDPDVPLLQSGH